jgi:hypothetical protein
MWKSKSRKIKTKTKHLILYSIIGISVSAFLFKWIIDSAIRVQEYSSIGLYQINTLEEALDKCPEGYRLIALELYNDKILIQCTHYIKEKEKEK